MLTVKIITPERSWEPKQYDSVTLPAFDGQVGILVNHAPFVCQLGRGVLRLRSKQAANDLDLALSGGVAQVADNEVRILAESVVAVDEIDDEALLRELHLLDDKDYEDSVEMAEAQSKAFWIATQLKAKGKTVPDLKKF
ncbi:MAG: ATP synthase F1 subunit epsilon [Planctomycetota bacterium]|jgi:F-type H+-transporting ATPase subunit epsilon|nr:ATP synthase F1 subunit epsilon [Planctomycetota bacterium]